MKIIEYIGEVTKPVGTVYVKFRVLSGNVPPNASKEEKRAALYLSAITGFHNSPTELTAANARLRFKKLTNMADVVKMIKDIMSDDVFISAKKMTIYMDLPNSAYNLFPFLREFISWVGKNGGDRIQVEFAPEREKEDNGPAKKRKENPNKGLKQVDYDPADPQYTINFTVSDRFYDAVRKGNAVPGLMQFKGPGHEFRMPKEMFDKFRDEAQKRYGDVGIRIVKKAHTSEDIEQVDEGAEELELDERGPASRSLCLSKKSNSQLGASQLASCKSQGLRAREGDKSHKFKDGKRAKVGGKKIKGKAHGGPLPDWGTRGSKK